MKIININNHHLVTQCYGWNGGRVASMSSVWFESVQCRQRKERGFIRYRQTGKNRAILVSFFVKKDVHHPK